MKIRTKGTHATGKSDKFNEHALFEIIVYFDDGDCTSDFVDDWEVFIESKQAWVDMKTAFAEKLIIPDDYNLSFREPENEAEKEQGWY